MKKSFKTLFAKELTPGRVVYRADDKNQKLDLSLPSEAIEKIRRIEESFAMAEQNLGTLRVG